MGRPTSRWLDEVNREARKLKIRMQWRRALHREDCRKLLVEAKTVHELLAVLVVVIMIMMMLKLYRTGFPLLEW